MEINVLSVRPNPTNAVMPIMDTVTNRYSDQIRTPLSVSKRKTAAICLDSLKALICVFLV